MKNNNQPLENLHKNKKQQSTDLCFSTNLHIPSMTFVCKKRNNFVNKNIKSNQPLANYVYAKAKMSMQKQKQNDLE